jgi:hypothetical protein
VSAVEVGRKVNARKLIEMVGIVGMMELNASKLIEMMGMTV